MNLPGEPPSRDTAPGAARHHGDGIRHHGTPDRGARDRGTPSHAMPDDEVSSGGVSDGEEPSHGAPDRGAPDDAPRPQAPRHDAPYREVRRNATHAHDQRHGMDQQQTPPATPPGDGPYGETADEAALRAMMRQAVDGLRGSPDALERLRYAVPARRRHRRQARIGAVAALVLVGVAVPAVVRVAGTGGESGTTAASVGSTHTPAPGEQGHTRPWDGPGSTTAPASPDPYTPGPRTSGESGPPTGVTSVPTAGVPVPDCSAAQLGHGSSGAATPDADGRVYGWFRVANVSGSPCAVPDGGVVRAVVLGGGDPSRVLVVAHRPGDPATGLPDAAPAGPLVLTPGADYEVAFAWVPDSGEGPGGCAAATPPPDSPTPTATATATPTGDPTAAAGAPSGAGGDGAAAQANDQGPSTPPQAGIAIDHTPAAGAPVVDGPVIQGACAGTVYTTAAIPDPSASATTTPTP